MNTHLIIAVAFVSAVAGCSGSGVNKDDYQRRLKQVDLGMTKKDFWALFPEAEQRGAKQYPKGAVEVLAVNWSYYSFTPTGEGQRDTWSGTQNGQQWFYFYNGQLVQYGNPNDWPAEPDKIIEVRQR